MGDLLLPTIAVLLVAGAFVADRKLTSSPGFQRTEERPSRTLARWAIKTLVIAFLLEVTLFNLPHYALAGMRQNIKVDLAAAELSNATYTEETGVTPVGRKAAFAIKGPGTKVGSVHLDIRCGKGGRSTTFEVEYADAESSLRTTRGTIVRKDLATNYLQVRPYGNVTGLTIHFDPLAPRCSVERMVINQPMPLNVHWWQLLVWSISGGLIGCGVVHRRRLALALTQPRFHRLLSGAIAGTVVILVVWTAATSSYSAGTTAKDDPSSQYSWALTRALRAGHLHLEYPVSQSLKDDPNPYDVAQRKATHVDAIWDVAFYNDHYYSYFGVVPVLTVFLPFNLLTGGYLGNAYAVALFGAVAALALMAVWRSMCRRFLPSVPHSLYFLGLAALPVSSMLLYVARRPLYYEVAVTAGMAFAATGVALLLQVGREGRRNWAWAVTGCAALALAVGCRPNLILLSILAVPLLWPWVLRRSAGLGIRMRRLGLIAIPYALVGAFLAWYNHARFDSIFEFGQSYQITTQNNAAYWHLTPVGIIEKGFAALSAYMAQLYKFATTFPFVTEAGPVTSFHGYIYAPKTVGLICLPIVLLSLALPWLHRPIRHRSRQLWWLLIAMLGVGLVIMAITGVTVGVHPRYLADFTWLFVLVGLSAAVFLYERFRRNPTAARLTLYGLNALIVIGMVGMVLLSLTGERDRLWVKLPEVYLQVQHLLAPWSSL